MKYIFDDALIAADLKKLILLLLIISIVQIIREFLSFINSTTFSAFNLETLTAIRKDLFYKLLRLPYSFFDNQQTGYVLSRIGETSGLSALFSDSLINLVVGVLEFVFSLVVLIKLNSKLTLVALSFLPFYFLAGRYFGNVLRGNNIALLEKNAAFSRKIQESLLGVEVIKTFSAEDRETQNINTNLDDIRTTSIKNGYILSASSGAISLIGTLGGLIVLWYSGISIVQGSLTIGTYIAFGGYLSKIYGPTLSVAIAGISLQPALLALNRTSEFFDLVREDEDANRSIQLRNISDQIVFQNVSFAYNGIDIIKNANFSIHGKEHVLFKGRNGAGKTTIMKLLLALYRPDKGKILIDGKDINNINISSLRENISIVSQNIFLFNDSIENNIKYSRPNARQEDIDEAILLSGVGDFYQSLTGGLKTVVGEMGKKLSGGEKQKISLARAILKNSDVIVLDEAASNLDSDSAKRISQLLKNIFKDKICLIISHREWDLDGIGRILEVEQGSVSEAGIRFVSPTSGLGPMEGNL